MVVLADRFVLHSDGATTRKNLAALAVAWPAIRAQVPDVELVLCGSPHPTRDRLFAGLGGVHLMGHLARDAQIELIRAATVVVVPSTYEGFGLPALEAMAAGTAVVAARCAALPEVCGDAALLCAPDAAALATAIVAVLGHDGLRQRLEGDGQRHAAGFTWDRSARRHAEIFQAALENRGPSNRGLS